MGRRIPVADSTHAAVVAACDLAGAHQLPFWDALIASVAVAQQRRVLLSEDFQDGFVWQGLTAVNPFAVKPHILFAQLSLSVATLQDLTPASLASGNKSTQSRDIKHAQKNAHATGDRSVIKTKAKSKLLPFDAARYLKDDAAIAEYMTAVFETDDTDLLLLALSDIARAKGMAQVAKDSGLGRESLYKALAPGAKPRFDTILKVTKALGVRLRAAVV